MSSENGSRRVRRCIGMISVYERECTFGRSSGVKEQKGDLFPMGNDEAVFFFDESL